MSTYNGLVCTLARGFTAGNTLLTGVTSVGVTYSVPAKFFDSGMFGILCTQGVSGSFGVQIIGGVGGSTFAIAGRTAITAAGSYPVPLIAYVGTSGVNNPLGFPRPYSVEFSTTGISSIPVGFTATVFMCGDYD